MSVQKCNQLAEEKSTVDQQTQDIHQKFRMDKISKEFGQLSGEELFKPITKKLDEKSSTTAQEVEESPDYAMDEFDRTYPFGEELRPDAPTPEPTPSPSPEPTSPPPNEDVDGDDFPPPPPSSLLHGYSVEDLKKIRDGIMKKEGQPNLYRNSWRRGRRA